MDFRVFIQNFERIFGTIRRRFRRAFRRIFIETNFRVLIQIFGTIFGMIRRRARRSFRRIFRGTFGRTVRARETLEVEQDLKQRWKHWKESWVLEHVKESVEWVQKKWNFQVDVRREPSKLHLYQHCVKHRWSCQW